MYLNYLSRRNFNVIKRFYRKLINIFKWLPVLWKDENWDYEDILEILRHKIKLQREYIKKYGYHTRADRDCKNMRVAELLIERIINKDYTEADFKEHEKLYPKEDVEDFLSFLNRPKRLGESENLRRIMHKEEYLRKQDLTYLFKHLNKHLTQWWD